MNRILVGIYGHWYEKCILAGEVCDCIIFLYVAYTTIGITQEAV